MVRKFAGILALFTVAGGALGAYSVREGDTLSIRYVLGIEDLAVIGPVQMELQVPPGGMLTLPYAGEVMAASRTVSELQAEITRRLSNRFRSPEAFVVLSKVRQDFYSLIGEVTNGGQFPLEPGLTLREALAQGKGYSRRPETLRAVLFRRGKPAQEFDLFTVSSSTSRLGEVALEPGDVISIQTRRQERVWLSGFAGEVGAKTVEDGTTVQQLVADSAPPVQRSEKTFVTVVRSGNPVFRASVYDLTHGRVPPFPISDGDFVSLAPEESVRIWVFGAVADPGQHDIPASATVALALAESGGVKPEASLRRVRLLRAGGSREVNLVPGQSLDDASIPVRDGDILVVPENANRVAVFGEVVKPGVHTLRDEFDARLSDAIALAGGLTKRGPANRVWILRAAGDGKTEKIPVDFSRFLKNGESEFNPLLQPADVIMVGETPRLEFSQVMSGVLGLIGIGNFLK